MVGADGRDRHRLFFGLVFGGVRGHWLDYIYGPEQPEGEREPVERTAPTGITLRLAAASGKIVNWRIA